MKAIEQLAMAEGFKEIQLDYMSDAPWLKEYYEKIGFVETGQVEKWGLIDLVQMSKSL